MVPYSFNNRDLETFRAANSLLRNPYQSRVNSSFTEVFENQVKEVTTKIKEQTSEIIEENKDTKKKTKGNLQDELPDISKIIKNNETRNLNSLQKTYSLLEKFKDFKKLKDEEHSQSSRKQFLSNVHGFVGNPLIQPLNDHGQRKMSKSHMLAVWEKFSPMVTEYANKKSVRIDIPLLHDVQALVLRLNPDRSITASLLGSQEMTKLIKDNKDKLDKNLRHHHLSLKEFNTYNSELTFNTESGTKKQKKKVKQTKKAEIDLI